MIKFLKRNWTLIIVFLYLILPDLLPTWLDDVSLLIVERTLVTFLNRRRKKKEEAETTTANVQNRQTISPEQAPAPQQPVQ